MHQPLSLAQVRRLRDGRLAQVDSDVLDIAKQIREIDPSLLVRHSEGAEGFVVFQREQHDGHVTERLVTTSKTLDGRLLAQVRKITSPDYDLGKEADMADAQARQRADEKLAEEVGLAGERAYHAIRKDRGYKSRIIVP